MKARIELIEKNGYVKKVKIHYRNGITLVLGKKYIIPVRVPESTRLMVYNPITKRVIPIKELAQMY